MMSTCRKVLDCGNSETRWTTHCALANPLLSCLQLRGCGSRGWVRRFCHLVGLWRHGRLGHWARLYGDVTFHRRDRDDWLVVAAPKQCCTQCAEERSRKGNCTYCDWPSVRPLTKTRERGTTINSEVSNGSGARVGSQVGARFRAQL